MKHYLIISPVCTKGVIWSSLEILLRELKLVCPFIRLFFLLFCFSSELKQFTQSNNVSSLNSNIVLDEKQWLHYLNMLSRAFSEANKSTYSICPGCQIVVKTNPSSDKNSAVVRCKCTKVFCFKCTLDSHVPASCKDVRLFFFVHFFFVESYLYLLFFFFLTVFWTFWLCINCTFSFNNGSPKILMMKPRLILSKLPPLSVQSAKHLLNVLLLVITCLGMSCVWCCCFLLLPLSFYYYCCSCYLYS